MAIPFPTQLQEQDGDDDYIDMDLNIPSSFNLIRDYHDFEFQMSSSSTFQAQPADQLFRNGRLLPLNNINNPDPVDNPCLKPPSTAPVTITSTPSTCSRNVSPSQSCRVSCELNPEEYFFEWSTEIRGFIHNRPKESWSKKTRKYSSLCHKLRYSGWTFIKSLFTKPGVCVNESSCTRAAAAACNLGAPLKVKDLLYAQFVKVEDRSPCKLSDAIVRSIERLELRRDVRGRRSFSGAIRRQRHPVTNKSGTMNSSSGTCSSSSSSSSSSFSSASPNDLPLLRNSANSELEREGSIEGAIAHCKQSQSQFGTNLV